MIARNRDYVADCIQAMAEGDAQAREHLYEATYQELRELADRLMVHQSPGHTLQATALVNEAAVRLMGNDSPVQFNDLHHFYAAISKAMRCVLVDHARKRNSLRRGGAFERIDLDFVLHELEALNHVELLELDEALTKLEDYNERHAELVNLRFFLGMTVDEIAVQLGVSRSTVERDWRFVRAWLAEELQSV